MQTMTKQRFFRSKSVWGWI